MLRGDPRIARLMGGVGLTKPKTRIAGVDAAGRIQAVAADVHGLRPGDEVFGFTRGAFAEYAIADAALVVPKPAGLSFEQAAAIPMAAVTALHAIRDRGRVQPGQRVLVNGAAGGVGTFAVQIAAARGCEVIATARTPEQMALVRSLGATHVVDWSAGELVEQVRTFAPGGVDGFVDLVKHAPSMKMGVGEDEAHRLFAELCRGLLRDGGRASSVTNGGVPELLGGIVCANVHSTPTPESIARLTELVESGSVVAPIHGTVDFDDIEVAFERLDAGPALGKISVVLEQGSTA